MRTADAPSHNRLSHFRCELATITGVNPRTYTVVASTTYTAKEVPDIQVMVPYHHYANGEGSHHMPEIGAQCLVAFPSDNSAPFVMGYLGVPSVQTSQDGSPERSTSTPDGSPTDVSQRSRRLGLTPGSIGITTRDENFLVLHRGGVVQIGATSIAQRVYIPVLNFIKDFCENYEMHTFAGDVAWHVERSENDPSGDAPATYTFHLNEFAQDAKATVRVRHMPLAAPGGGDKSAWEIHVAPQGISRDDGSVTNEVYSLVVTTGGDKTEILGGSRTVTIDGDDSLTVHGSRTVRVDSNEVTTAGGKIEHIADGENVVGGARVRLGSRGASDPAVLGPALVQWLSTTIWIVNPATSTATPSPAAIATLQRILSRKVLLE